MCKGKSSMLQKYSILLSTCIGVFYSCADTQMATKGALTEAAFILHNKAYEIKEMQIQVERALEQTQLQDKRLEQEKILLEKAVARHRELLKNAASKKAGEQMRQELEQSKTIFLVHMTLVYANKFTQKLYRELVKTSAAYKEYVEKKGLEFIGATILYAALRVEVEKAQLIKKLLFAQKECVQRALVFFQQEAKVKVEKQRLTDLQKIIPATQALALRMQLLTEKAKITHDLKSSQARVTQKKKLFIQSKTILQRLNTQLTKIGLNIINGQDFLDSLTVLFQSYQLKSEIPK